MPTSSSLSSELREFAESPDRFTLLSPDVERYVDERVCIVQGATWASVSDIRTDDVAGLLADVRARAPAEKRAIWLISPSAQPGDLTEQLLALGLREPLDRIGRLHALACATPPPQSPGIDVRAVDTFEEHLTATELMWDGFETPEARRE